VFLVNSPHCYRLNLLNIPPMGTDTPHPPGVIDTSRLYRFSFDIAILGRPGKMVPKPLDKPSNIG